MSIITDYLAKLSQPEHEALEHIRQRVISLAPDAEEVITYGMPGFKHNGKYLLAFSAFKDHLSLFPGAEPVESIKARLDGFTMSKGTIQFTPEKPIPDDILTEIIQLCLERTKQ